MLEAEIENIAGVIFIDNERLFGCSSFAMLWQFIFSRAVVFLAHRPI